MTQALERLTVIDLTQVMAGPFCCQLLGDLGARIVKVEPVGSGDNTRHSMGHRMPGGESSAFLAVNRNKQSIAIDLKQEAGRDAFYKLVRSADVVVENFRPGVTSRLGVDYAILSRLNSRLIYASISGFGQTGPYADRPGYDLIAQAMSGIMSVTGEAGGKPAKAGVPVTDMSAGLFCAVGILAACIAREQTGRGQYIDTSLYEAGLALSVWETAELWATGRVPQPLGSAHRMTAPYQALRTRDGHIMVGANNPRLWQRLCRALDREDLLSDPRFTTNADRMERRDVLAGELESVLKSRDTEDWVAALLAAGVPCGPLRDYEQVCRDPHTLAREMVVTMQHPVEGEIRGLGIPVKLSDTPGNVRRPAPLLGEHTDELLAGLGYSASEISALREQGAVA
ncbi:MAG TPA: CoA transferase [Streptosporangiaceae bacterium]|nr:CoA transferase [Streptosporangiaceae bacterium]